MKIMRRLSGDIKNKSTNNTRNIK